MFKNWLDLAEYYDYRAQSLIVEGTFPDDSLLLEEYRAKAKFARLMDRQGVVFTLPDILDVPEKMSA